MLRRLYVDNYRCLVNFELRPEAVNLLVGRNGSGKSTFLEVLQILSGLVAGESPTVLFQADTLPWWDTRKSQTFEVELDDEATEDRFVYRLVVKHSDKDGAAIVEERLTRGSAELFGFSGNELRLSGLKEAIGFEGRQSVVALGLGLDPAAKRFLAQLRGLRVFRLNPWSFEAQSRNEWSVLNSNGSNLVSFLRAWSQSDPAGFLQWNRKAQEVMPQFDDLKLRELAPGNRMLVGSKRVDGSERLISAINFSEGERCLLALYAIAYSSHRGVLALDEPDNFLSPSEVQPILRTLTGRFEDGLGNQLFVVTHHPESIDYLAAYQTWLFEKSSDGVVRVRPLEFDREGGERPTDALMAGSPQ